jgi:hypothetical protein
MRRMWNPKESSPPGSSVISILTQKTIPKDLLILQAKPLCTLRQPLLGGATSGAVTYFDKAADGNISNKDIAIIAVATLSGALKGVTLATFGPTRVSALIGAHINLAEQALSVAIEHGGKKMDPANAGLNVVAKAGAATIIDAVSAGLGKGLDKAGASLGETMEHAVTNTEKIFIGGGSEAAAGAAGAQAGVKRPDFSSVRNTTGSQYRWRQVKLEIFKAG